ncbi:MAG: hypothetical protein ABSE73_05900 [Planctomycetota bacterium]
MSATTDAEKLSDAAPGKPRRRRGPLFWLFLAFLVVLLAPVVLYLGVLVYVACGFMNGKAAARISSVFEAPAEIASVRTQWLRNLKLDKIAVRAPDNSTPVTVDAVTLDWDIGPFLTEGRIRTMAIERPQIALRRNAQGQWNIHPNLASAGAYRLEEIIMREGDLAIEWPAPGSGAAAAAFPARLRLQALSGTLADHGPLAPKTFSLYGVFDSLENVSVTGSYGPGAAWTARISGGLNLGRDLAGMLYPSPQDVPEHGESVNGHVRYDISAGDESPAAALDFSGQFILENLHWPLASGCALDVPRRTVDLSGTARLDTGPEQPAAFDKLQLRVDGVGTLHGQGAWLSQPAARFTLQNVAGKMDGKALNELFQPRLWGDALTLKGSVELSDLSAALPSAPGNPAPDAPTAEARGAIALENADLTIALPRLFQEAVLNVLKMSAYGYAAPLFEKEPTESVAFGGLSARSGFQIKDQRLTFSNGRIQPCDLRAVLPVVGERAFRLPAVELECDLGLTHKPDGRPDVWKLKLPDGTQLEVSFRQLVPKQGGAPEKAGGAWVVNGSFGTPAWGGLAATFSLTLDLAQRQIGPATIVLKDLDLAKVEAWLADAGMARPAGHVKDLEIKLAPYSLKPLAAVKTWEVRGAFEGVRFSGPYAEAEQLSGDVRILAGSSSNSLDANSLLLLKSGRAWLHGGTILIPPGQEGAVKLVGKYARCEKGTDIKLEQLRVNVGEEVTLEASGELALEGGSPLKAHVENLKVTSGKTTLNQANINGKLSDILGDLLKQLKGAKE